MHPTRQLKTALLSCVGTLALAPAVAVADDDPKRPQPDVGELIKRIEKLEEDKSEMQGEIAELRAELGDDWLTERRADEIKNLVADVLADADNRSSMLQGGITAGWDGNFFLASTDDRFRLQIDGLMQIRWVFNYHDSPESAPGGGSGAPTYLYGFENTRTRLTFRGHVFDRNLTYLVRTDIARGELTVGGADGLAWLRDAWVRYAFNDEFSLRVGQFKLPFNREELVSPADQLVIERSLVNQTLNLGRSQGIELVWQGESGRFSFAFSDGAEDGMFIGTPVVASFPLNSVWSKQLLAEYAFTARYEQLFAGTWEQFKSLTSPPGEDFGILWGIAAHYQQDQAPVAGTTSPKWFAFTTDLSVEWGGANIFAAFIYENVSPTAVITGSQRTLNTFGAVIQGGAYFSEKLEGYVRMEYGTFDLTGIPFGDLLTLTLGCNYYFHGQDVKFSTDVGFGLLSVDTPWVLGAGDIAGWRRDFTDQQPQVVIRTQLQLLF